MSFPNRRASVCNWVHFSAKEHSDHYPPTLASEATVRKAHFEGVVMLGVCFSVVCVSSSRLFLASSVTYMVHLHNSVYTRCYVLRMNTMGQSISFLLPWAVPFFCHICPHANTNTAGRWVPGACAAVFWCTSMHFVVVFVPRVHGLRRSTVMTTSLVCRTKVLSLH